MLNLFFQTTARVQTRVFHHVALNTITRPTWRRSYSTIHPSTDTNETAKGDQHTSRASAATAPQEGMLATPEPIRCDICIVGAGLAGSALFHILRKIPDVQELSILLLDTNSGPTLHSISDIDAPSIGPSQYSRLRTVSLTETSQEILSFAGVTNLSSMGCLYESLCVRDPENTRFLLPGRGCVVRNDALLAELHRNLPSASGLSDGGPMTSSHVLWNTRIKHIHVPTVEESGYPLGPVELRVTTIHDDEKKITTTREIHALLVIGCDGAQSTVRRLALSNEERFNLEYGQQAVVAAVEVEKPMTTSFNSCYQNFLSDGSIVGMLPTGLNTANIVYSTSTSNAHEMVRPFLESKNDKPHSSDLACREEVALGILNAALHYRAPHEIPRCVKLQPNIIASFPLSCSVIKRPSSMRVALVGDAARSIHPMGGQGLNLGLYDVAILCDALYARASCGHDPGEVYEDYNPRWLLHTAPILAGQEVVKSLFAASSWWIRLPRMLGLNVLDRCALAQQALASLASGKYLSSVVLSQNFNRSPSPAKE